MNQEQIKKILPHRDDMLLVDEAEVIDGEAHGRYTVRGDEFFLNGHFPGNPVVPGVILCEILAQSTCVLLSEEIESGVTPYFTGISNARFKAMVKPGDVIETKCVITKKKAPFYFASGEMRVGGNLALKADFSFALVK
jgi:3-hydroxyacyl-[acyl-carrier-protein] dehydratase